MPGEKGLYIAGPISAIPHLTMEEKRRRFDDTQKLFENEGEFQFVLNPLWIVPNCGLEPPECRSTTKRINQAPGQEGPDDSHSWECYMRSDMLGLLACHAIALLPGYHRSPGAMLELQVADHLNYRKIYMDVAPNGDMIIAGGDK